MMLVASVNVLGTKYRILKKNLLEDSELEECDGYCDYTTKTIVIADIPERPSNVEDLKEHENRVLRHELVHAFFFESGLGETLGSNEELVDWIAFQIPKMTEVFYELDIT